MKAAAGFRSPWWRLGPKVLFGVRLVCSPNGMLFFPGFFVATGGDADGGVFGREEGFEAVFVDGLHVGLHGGDVAVAEVFPDGFVHELHAFGFAADDDVVEFLGGAFADDGADGGIGDEDFVDGNAAFAIGLFHEELGDDAFEGGGEHGADLALLVGGEDVDDPVNGFAGVVGVEGAEDEQAGFGGGEGE